MGHKTLLKNCYHTLNFNLRSKCFSTHFVGVLENMDGHVRFRTTLSAVAALSQWITRKQLYKEVCLTK